MTGRRTVVAALLAAAALGLAACGDSPEDEARKDGEAIGSAMRELVDARSPEEARAAASELQQARAAVDEDTANKVRGELENAGEQVQSLVDAIGQAAASGSQDALQGVRSAVQNMRQQAETLQEGDDSVVNEFWRGVSDGYQN
jgi:hypothetical protein